MTTIDFARRRAPAVLVAVLTGGVIAACGSSSSSSTTNAASGASASASAGGGARPNRAAFRECLQRHGVTLPSRPPGGASGGPPPGGGPPAGGGGGFFGGGGGAAGAFRNNPKFRAAVQACGGGNFRGGARRFQISHRAINNYVACVRTHGYNMPSPNFSGKGPVFPAKIRTDPKFLAASKSCQSLLFPRRATTTTGSTAQLTQT